MFNFLKKTKKAEINESKASLTEKLAKTKNKLQSGLSNLFLGEKKLDKELLQEIELALLSSDVGTETTSDIITKLTNQLTRNQLKDPTLVYSSLKKILEEILAPYVKKISLESRPNVILFVGINGAGKTTSIGKFAKKLTNQNLKVTLAAGDTFRAAAVEQLQEWGSRNNINIISHKHKSEGAAVIYDAVSHVIAKQQDVLLADTAGRLHTQDNLMQELAKIKRVIQKQIPEAPHHTILVLDATSGQNAIQQAEQFYKQIGASGIIVTKLDGSAKGGVLFAIANKLKLPIHYIGVGEQIDDLREFNANEFIEALFADPNQ